MTKTNKHIPTIWFLLKLLRLKGKVHSVKHCIVLVRVLIKRYTMFSIATFSFIRLHLRLSYPSFQERNKSRKRQLVLRLLCTPKKRRRRIACCSFHCRYSLCCSRCFPCSPLSPPSPSVTPSLNTDECIDACVPWRVDCCVVSFDCPPHAPPTLRLMFRCTVATVFSTIFGLRSREVDCYEACCRTRSWVWQDWHTAMRQGQPLDATMPPQQPLLGILQVAANARTMLDF